MLLMMVSQEIPILAGLLYLPKPGGSSTLRTESPYFNLANQAPLQVGLEDSLPLSPHPPLLQIQENMLFSAPGLYLYLSAYTWFSLVALPLTLWESHIPPGPATYPPFLSCDLIA